MPPTFKFCGKCGEMYVYMRVHKIMSGHRPTPPPTMPERSMGIRQDRVGGL